MTPTLGTLGGGEESPPTLSEINERIENQYGLMDRFMTPVITDIMERVADQEQRLRDVYRPEIQTINESIKRHGDTLSRLMQTEIADINTAVIRNQTRFNTLQQMFPPEPVGKETSGWSIYVRCSDRAGFLVDASDQATAFQLQGSGAVLVSSLGPMTLEQAQLQYAQQISQLVVSTCDAPPPATVPPPTTATGFKIWYYCFSGAQTADWAVTPADQTTNPLAPYGGPLPDVYATREEAVEAGKRFVIERIANGDCQCEWFYRGAVAPWKPPCDGPVVVLPPAPVPGPTPTTPPVPIPPEPPPTTQFCPVEKPDPCQEDKPFDVVTALQNIKPPAVCDFNPISPTYCETVAAAIQPYHALGVELRKLLAKYGDRIASADKSVHTLLFKIPYVGKLLSTVWDLIPFSRVAEILVWATRRAETLEKPESDILVSLWTVKAIVRLVENISVGWELGPQILTSLRIEFPQLIQVIDYLISYVCPITAPDVSTIQSLYLANLVSEKHAECMGKFQGYRWRQIEREAFARRSHPTEDLAVRNWLRFRAPEQSLYDQLRKYGWLDREETEQLIRSFDYQPPPGDLIQFAVRDVFLRTKLGRPEMVKEYADQVGLKEWFATQGIGKFPIRLPNGQPLLDPSDNTPYDVGLLYWLAHYHNISPSQAYEMLHRIRPERVANFQIPGLKPVAIDDVARMLREDDYNPIWRDRLIAISYRVLTRVDVRRIYRSGGFGAPRYLQGFRETRPGEYEPTGPAETEVAAQYQDQGYNRKDAIRIARFTADEASRLIMGKSDARHKTLVCKAYQAGVLDDKTAVKELTPILRSETEAIRFVRLCDVERRLKDVTAATAATRKLFLRGQYSEQEATAALTGLGVNAGRIKETITLWKLQMAGQRRELTAAQMCDDLEHKRITQAEVVIRLRRIGYVDDDIRRILDRCRFGIELRSQKERERLARERAKQEAAEAKERERQATLAAREAMSEFKRRMSAFTDTNIRKWYFNRDVSLDEVRAVLRVRGWLEEQVRDYIHNLEIERGEYDRKKAAENGKSGP